MAKNAIQILEDDEVLNTFKEKAFENAKRFDIKNILPIYEAVYERALQFRFKNIH